MAYALFILYVRDQLASRDFYQRVLKLEATLDVPGMTEFQLGPDTFLGLMPEAGIKRLLGEPLPDPSTGSGIPRCELYLVVEDPAGHLDRLEGAGGKRVSELQERNWGQEVAYGMDLDGHVLAFASPGTGTMAQPS